MPGVPGGDEPRARIPRTVTIERRAAQSRRVSFVELPRPHVDDFDPQDVLEALIETITEELTEAELAACAEQPIGKDPVYWLIRKHFADEMTLDQIGRLWAVSRERIRQIESKALARKAVTKGLQKHAPEDSRLIETRETRAEALNETIRKLLLLGHRSRAIAQMLGVQPQLVGYVKRDIAKEVA